MSLLELSKPKEKLSKITSEEKSRLINTINKKRGDGKPAKIGNEFEKEIEQTNQVYLENNLAYFKKFTPPTTWIPPRNGKEGFMMYSKKAGFDFIGGIVSTKEAIFIECKTTKEGRIDVGNDKTGIKQHQIDEMVLLEKMGFQVYILWKVRGDYQAIVYKFSPTQMITAIGDNHSLSAMECEDFGFERMIKTQYSVIEGLGNDGSIEIYDYLGLLQ